MGSDGRGERALTSLCTSRTIDIAMARGKLRGTSDGRAHYRRRPHAASRAEGTFIRRWAPRLRHLLGQGVLAAIQAVRSDLAVPDIMMREMTGSDPLEALR